jgi:hypothetical protein
MPCDECRGRIVVTPVPGAVRSALRPRRQHRKFLSNADAPLVRSRLAVLRASGSAIRPRRRGPQIGTERSCVRGGGRPMKLRWRRYPAGCNFLTMNAWVVAARSTDTLMREMEEQLSPQLFRLALTSPSPTKGLERLVRRQFPKPSVGCVGLDPLSQINCVRGRGEPELYVYREIHHQMGTTGRRPSHRTSIFGHSRAAPFHFTVSHRAATWLPGR